MTASVRRIDRAEVRRLMDAGAQVAEVLPEEEYAAEHLPGAIHLPLNKLDASLAAERLDATQPVIVYCWDSL